MILITGAAGFIGSNLAAGLNDRGETGLVLCDRLRSGEKWKNIRARRFDDLVTPEDLPLWLSGRGKALRAVFHLGAISSTTVTDATMILDGLSPPLTWSAIATGLASPRCSAMVPLRMMRVTRV